MAHVRDEAANQPQPGSPLTADPNLMRQFGNEMPPMDVIQAMMKLLPIFTPDQQQYVDALMSHPQEFAQKYPELAQMVEAGDQPADPHPGEHDVPITSLPSTSTAEPGGGGATTDSLLDDVKAAAAPAPVVPPAPMPAPVVPPVPTPGIEPAPVVPSGLGNEPPPPVGIPTPVVPTPVSAALANPLATNNQQKTQDAAAAAVVKDPLMRANQSLQGMGFNPVKATNYVNTYGADTLNKGFANGSTLSPTGPKIDPNTAAFLAKQPANTAGIAGYKADAAALK